MLRELSINATQVREGDRISVPTTFYSKHGFLTVTSIKQGSATTFGGPPSKVYSRYVFEFLENNDRLLVVPDGYVFKTLMEVAER